VKVPGPSDEDRRMARAIVNAGFRAVGLGEVAQEDFDEESEVGALAILNEARKLLTSEAAEETAHIETFYVPAESPSDAIVKLQHDLWCHAVSNAAANAMRGETVFTVQVRVEAK